jgi:hypothetical protein
MRSRVSLPRISILLVAGACLALPTVAPGQDSSGRPTVVQDPSGRPKPRKKGTKPKKVIRAAPPADKAPTSSVIIRSYPPDAEVFVDGKLVGTTADDGELELSDLRLGAHRIVLKKDGYREWAQTVTLTSSTETEEIEPLLQSENAYFRDIAKLPVVELGRELAGQISRDSIAAKDGKTFYNEYVLRVSQPDAYVIVLGAKGGSPSVRLVDESNITYSIESIGEGVYQSVVVPRPGHYYVQVMASLDESSFSGGQYTLTVIEERVARAERPLAIGDTLTGALAATDRLAGPGDYYDSYSLTGGSGSAVRIAVTSGGEFTPGLTLLLDGRVIASSGKADDKGKKKKKNEPVADGGGAEIRTTLNGGTYKLYVRSIAGAKKGTYQLSVTAGG